MLIIIYLFLLVIKLIKIIIIYLNNLFIKNL
jgi:hypothetical protein